MRATEQAVLRALVHGPATAREVAERSGITAAHDRADLAARELAELKGTPESHAADLARRRLRRLEDDQLVRRVGERRNRADIWELTAAGRDTLSAMGQS